MSKGQNEIRPVCGSTVLLMYPDIYTATFIQPHFGLKVSIGGETDG